MYTFIPPCRACGTGAAADGDIISQEENVCERKKNAQNATLANLNQRAFWECWPRGVMGSWIGGFRWTQGVEVAEAATGLRGGCKRESILPRR